MNTADAYELTDTLVATVTERPGQTAAKIARRLRLDTGAVRRTLMYLAREQYVTLTQRGGRETYGPAGR